MKNIVVLGAGLSGLASAALLSRAGHQVTVIERQAWVGGKSRRVEVAGQRMDTGPALVTFPGVLEEFFSRYNALGDDRAQDIAPLTLEKLNEVGEYFFKDHKVVLPVPQDHPWFSQWQRFEAEHKDLAEPITKLLTTSPMGKSALPAVAKIFKRYGKNLTAEKFLKNLSWMDEDLKEVIAIHTLNAGIAPKDTSALYVSITAVMSSQGISVPTGGVNQIPQMLKTLAEHAGAKIQLNERVTRVAKGFVQSDRGEYHPDLVVSSLDPEVLRSLMGKKPKPWPKRSCSGVAIYAVLKKPLPEHFVTHSVVMPDSAAELHESLDAALPPRQTMAFLNYYKPQEIYPNQKATVAVLLTAPADGKNYDLNSEWVRAELDRISDVVGLSEPIDHLFEDYVVLDPDYFGDWGGPGGALYGKTRKLWQAGPFHLPSHNSPLTPWLWRVGASVHPGGGIPAVLGGAMIATERLQKKY
jgi:phytoene desaturase